MLALDPRERSPNVEIREKCHRHVTFEEGEASSVPASPANALTGRVVTNQMFKLATDFDTKITPQPQQPSTALNINAGDVSWRGPVRSGKTRSFRINPPEFASRAEAPYSGRLSRSPGMPHLRRDKVQVGPSCSSYLFYPPKHVFACTCLFRAQIELGAISSELGIAFSFYLVCRFFSRSRYRYATSRVALQRYRYAKSRVALQVRHITCSVTGTAHHRYRYGTSRVALQVRQITSSVTGTSNHEYATSGAALHVRHFTGIAEAVCQMRGPARPGKTRSFRISPLEIASSAKAPYSGRLMYYSILSHRRVGVAESEPSRRSHRPAIRRDKVQVSPSRSRHSFCLPRHTILPALA
ncbi:hypothetical protein J6590_083037 [Homalodisca vitripennis]|nr:hypothetical protein J6590_083037 [Homalodisca vitripennis]